MNRRNRPQFLPLTKLLTILFCLLLTGFAILLASLPGIAQQQFGAPGDRLSTSQRITYALRLLLHERDLVEPVQINSFPQAFAIEIGESVNSITARLEAAGIIRNASALRIFLTYSGLDTGIQAGEYELDPGWNAIQIAAALQDATPKKVLFVILPGWRVEEIAAAIPTSGLEFSPKEFLSVVYDPISDLFAQGIPHQKSMEGFLLPDTYHLDRTISVELFLKSALARFDEVVTEDIRTGFTHQGLSLAEGIILASIVQREAMVEDEMPLIASVFFNRLNDGMKLDSDPSVQYAVGSEGDWWKNPLTQSDLSFDSVYNTYLYPGLPPAPICNPSLTAMKAVAIPEVSPYYYFRALCDGSGRHAFAQTYAQHLQNACP
jgi:UPF0755 protein